MLYPSTKSQGIIYFLGLLFLAFVAQSYFANPPNGYTGAPGDGLCTDCHSPGNPNGLDGSISISGLPSSITPGMTYTISLTSSNPNGLAQYAGFQMVVLDDSDNNAGSLSNPSSNTTITNFAGRTYFEHDPAAEFPASNQVTWTVDWTAPSAPNGTQITIYAANNIANGNNNDGGDYIVTAQSSGTIMGSDPLTVSISSTTEVSCNGGSDGSATAQANGGTPSYSYSWSNGGSGETISNIPAGSYTVTATDSEGNTATATADISEPPAISITGTVTDINCAGENNGMISISINGGTSPYSANWSNGDNGTNIQNLSSGTYIVTVTDNNSCTETSSFTVEEPPPISISPINIEDVSCNGDSDGLVNVEAMGGTPPFIYTWSNGSSGPVNSNLSAGTYTVTVADANNCSAMMDFTVEEPPPLVVTTTAMDVSGPGETDGSVEANVNGGTNPYMYDWSNGDTGNPITGLPPGTYTVTVTDDNGCTATSTDSVEAFDCPLTASIALVDSIQCYGNSDGALSATSANGPDPSYAWSNGMSGDTITGLNAGTYTVTVTDSSNCTATSSYTLTQPDSISITISKEDESANNAEDGSATASVNGGTPPYTYSWSNGETGQMVDSLAPGTYSVTVTDENDCTATASTVINPFGCDFAVEIEQTGDILCAGDSTAVLEINVTEGGPIDSIMWSTGDTSMTISNLPGGMYTVTAVDTNDCVESANITVEEPDPIDVSVQTTDETANNANDGTASVEFSGGTPPFEILWSTGATSDSISNLSPGTYTVTVTDQNGCTGSGSGIVNPFGCDVSISPVIMNPLCADSTDGEICADIQGGTPPYTISWSTGATGDTCLSDLGEGTYSVTISDASNCTVSDTFELTAPDSLKVDVVEISGSDTGEENGSIDIEVSGGTSPYSFEWYLDDELVSTMEDPMNLASGMYSLELTDNNGCMLTVGPIEVPMEVAIVNPSENFQLQLYPNPVTDRVTIESSDRIEHVVISSLEGRQVRKIRHIDRKEQSFSVSEFAEGMYLIRIQWSGGETRIMKFIKQ